MPRVFLHKRHRCSHKPRPGLRLALLITTLSRIRALAYICWQCSLVPHFFLRKSVSVSCPLWAGRMFLVCSL